MLQVARLAPRLLGDAAPRVLEYLSGRFNGDGGARDRAGQSDLYYTVFALEGLLALQAEVPVTTTAAWLAAFGDGADLDLVHLACLARCHAALRVAAPEQAPPAGIAANIRGFRCPDGGFAAARDEHEGTIYHTFLARGALQDLGVRAEQEAALGAFLDARRTPDGGFANQPGRPVGSTTVTAAATDLRRQAGLAPAEGVAAWLLAQAHAEGGFLAAPGAPLPDLLSTATALHALAALQADVAPMKERCLDFIDTLWTGRAFCGTWADDEPDAEYTWYALLALGHLSLVS